MENLLHHKSWFLDNAFEISAHFHQKHIFYMIFFCSCYVSWWEHLKSHTTKKRAQRTNGRFSMSETFSVDVLFMRSIFAILWNVHSFMWTCLLRDMNKRVSRIGHRNANTILFSFKMEPITWNTLKHTILCRFVWLAQSTSSGILTY